MTDKRAKEKRILAWHFLPEDKRLRWETKEEVKVGRVYKVTGPLVMCQSGLHASERLIDALTYASGPWICRVEVWGDVLKSTDKIVARNRKVLAMINAIRLLHEFACDVMEKALRDAGITDGRRWAAIKRKRKWLDGKVTDRELWTADSKAWSAARSAVQSAARSAALPAALPAARSAANRLLTIRVKKAMGIT